MIKKLLLILFLSLNLMADGSHTFSSGKYYKKTTGVITDMPITMCAWNYSTSASGEYIISLCYDLTGGTIAALWDKGTNPDYLSGEYAVEGSGSVFWYSSNAYTLNAWHFTAGTFISSNSRAVFLGTTKTSNTELRNFPHSMTATYIGAANERGTLYNGFIGYIGYCGMWNVTLTDTELSELAYGIPPEYIHTNSCLGSWYLNENSGNAIDRSGNANTLTNTGTVPTNGNCAPVFIPSGGQ